MKNCSTSYAELQSFENLSTLKKTLSHMKLGNHNLRGILDIALDKQFFKS